MSYLRQAVIGAALLVAVYGLLPLAIFDFTSVAVPYDEENYGSQEVAIGPRPYWWVPYAAHDFDLPGGYDYSPEGWPFVVWKPLCVAFVKAKGYALPAEWR